MTFVCHTAAKLQEMSLQREQFVGETPSSLSSSPCYVTDPFVSDATELRSLDLVNRDIFSLFEIRHLSYCINLVELNMHCNGLESIDNLVHLPHLESLILSSNRIESMRGLDSLGSLTYLNLASNQIHTVEHLEGLSSLQRLILAHNQIDSLIGFSPERFQGDRPCLAVLDLKDNAIDHWELLAPLVHCEALRELHLQLDSAVENNECIGSYANPVCDAPAYRTTIQQSLPQLLLLDGRFLNVPPDIVAPKNIGVLDCDPRFVVPPSPPNFTMQTSTLIHPVNLAMVSELDPTVMIAKPISISLLPKSIRNTPSTAFPPSCADRIPSPPRRRAVRVGAAHSDTPHLDTVMQAFFASRREPRQPPNVTTSVLSLPPNSQTDNEVANTTDSASEQRLAVLEAQLAQLLHTIRLATEHASVSNQPPIEPAIESVAGMARVIQDPTAVVQSAKLVVSPVVSNSLNGNVSVIDLVSEPNAITAAPQSDISQTHPDVFPLPALSNVVTETIISNTAERSAHDIFAAMPSEWHSHLLVITVCVNTPQLASSKWLAAKSDSASTSMVLFGPADSQSECPRLQIQPAEFPKCLSSSDPIEAMPSVTQVHSFSSTPISNETFVPPALPAQSVVVPHPSTFEVLAWQQREAETRQLLLRTQDQLSLLAAQNDQCRELYTERSRDADRRTVQLEVEGQRQRQQHELDCQQQRMQQQALELNHQQLPLHSQWELRLQEVSREHADCQPIISRMTSENAKLKAQSEFFQKQSNDAEFLQKENENLRRISIIDAGKEQKAARVITELSHLLKQHEAQIATLVGKRDSEGDQYQQRIVELERQVVEQTAEVNRLKQTDAMERQRIETGHRTIAQQLETSQRAKVELVAALTEAQLLIDQKDQTLARWKRRVEEATELVAKLEARLVLQSDALRVHTLQLGDQASTLIQERQQHAVQLHQLEADAAYAERGHEALLAQLEEVSEREALLLQQAEQAEHVAIERQNLEAELLSARETLAAERGAVQLQRANSDKERDRLISSIESELRQMQHQQTERDQVRSQLERQLEEKVDEVGALELQIVVAETNAGEKEKLLVALRSELSSLHVKTEHAESKVMATEQEMRVLLREMDRQKAAAMQLAKLFNP